MKYLCVVLFILIHFVEGIDRCPWGCGEDFTDERLKTIGYLFWNCIEQTKFLNYESREPGEHCNCDDIDIDFYKPPGRLIKWHVSEYFPHIGMPAFLSPFAKQEYVSFCFQRSFYSKKKNASCPYHPDPFNDPKWDDPWEICRRCKKNIQIESYHPEDEFFVSNYRGIMDLFSVLENDINSAFNLTLRYLKLEVIESKSGLETKTLALSHASNEHDSNLLLMEIQELHQKIVELSAQLERTKEQLAGKLTIVEQTKENVDNIYADIYESCEQKHGLLHSMYYEAMRKFQNGSIEEALENILKLITTAKEMGMETSIDKEVL